MSWAARPALRLGPQTPAGPGRPHAARGRGRTQGTPAPWPGKRPWRQWWRRPQVWDGASGSWPPAWPLTQHPELGPGAPRPPSAAIGAARAGSGRTGGGAPAQEGLWGKETNQERVTAGKKRGGVTRGAQGAAGPMATGKGPLSGALGSTKVDEHGHNLMVLGYLLWAAPGSRYILVHAV